MYFLLGLRCVRVLRATAVVADAVWGRNEPMASGSPASLTSSPSSRPLGSRPIPAPAPLLRRPPFYLLAASPPPQSYRPISPSRRPDPPRPHVCHRARARRLGLFFFTAAGRWTGRAVARSYRGCLEEGGFATTARSSRRRRPAVCDLEPRAFLASGVGTTSRSAHA